MNIGFLFTSILVRPIVTVLVAIYQVLAALHTPYPLGFSIILLTIVIRVILYPLTRSQLKASKKMQEIAPHVARLKEKHKGDSKTLQAETMKLYKEFGINPAAGCVPTLIQLPIIWGLYSVLQQVVRYGSHDAVPQINKLLYIDAIKLTHAWDQSFFGLPLGKGPSQLVSYMPLILLVPVLTALFQFVQSKMMVPVKVKGKEEKKKDDFATAFQTQSLFIFPLMIGFFSYNFPIGISLYWNTFTVFGIIQQYRVSGLGGLAEWKQKFFPK